MSSKEEPLKKATDSPQQDRFTDCGGWLKHHRESFGWEHEGTLKLTEIASLNQAVSSYAASMERTILMIHLMSEIAFFSAVYGNSLNYVGIRDFVTPLHQEDPMYMVRYTASIARGKDGEFGDWIVGDRRQDIAHDILDYFVSSRQSTARTGQQAIYMSMVISSYAAFETFCIDIWTAIVNSDDSIGHRLLQGSEAKSLKLGHLAKYGFNLSGRLGSFLYETGSFSFLRIEDVQESFKRVVGNAATEIFDNRVLRHFESLRHLAAHRSATADAQYVSRLDKLSPDHGVRVGSKVELTGREVSDLIESSNIAARQLRDLALKQILTN